MGDRENNNQKDRSHVHFDADGTLRVQSVTANWIPEVTFDEEVRGIVYSVSGSYEGNETLDKKVERLLSKGILEMIEEGDFPLQTNSENDNNHGETE